MFHITTQELITGENGLLITNGLTEVQDLIAAGKCGSSRYVFISIHHDLTYHEQSLTPTGLITGQSGLNITNGSTTVIDLTAMGK